MREEVFIIEQQVDRDEEFDEFDDHSIHFAALNEWNEVVGTSRWRKTDLGIKLERFAVRRDFRNMGVGSALVEATMQDVVDAVGPGAYVYMHAQVEAVTLYLKYGFEKKGEMFMECDIAHYTMFKYT